KVSVANDEALMTNDKTMTRASMSKLDDQPTSEGDCAFSVWHASFTYMRDRFCRFFRGVLAGGGAIVVGLALTGCGTAAPEVTTYVHPTTGRRTDMVQQNLLDAPGNDREMLWLNAYRDFPERYQYKYYLEVIYGAREEAGYLEIGAGRTLTIRADN